MKSTNCWGDEKNRLSEPLPGGGGVGTNEYTLHGAQRKDIRHTLSCRESISKRTVNALFSICRGNLE